MVLLIGFAKIGTKPRYRVSTTQIALPFLSQLLKSAYWFTRRVLSGTRPPPLQGALCLPSYCETGHCSSLRCPNRPPKPFDHLVPQPPCLFVSGHPHYCNGEATFRARRIRCVLLPRLEASKRYETDRGPIQTLCAGVLPYLRKHDQFA